MPEQDSRYRVSINSPRNSLFSPYLKSPVALLTILSVVFYAALAWVWQYQILPAEKGLYSPFQSGLSFIKFIGLILLMNVIIAFSARGRNTLWVYLPLIITMFVLVMSAYYFHILLKA